MNVTIYTKDGCSYCSAAKSVMNSNGIKFKELKLNEDFTRQFIQENYPTAKTYPLIIIDGMYIGGYMELKETIKLQDHRKLLNE